jgi:hypothetical protein
MSGQEAKDKINEVSPRAARFVDVQKKASEPKHVDGTVLSHARDCGKQRTRRMQRIGVAPKYYFEDKDDSNAVWYQGSLEPFE